MKIKDIVQLFLLLKSCQVSSSNNETDTVNFYEEIKYANLQIYNISLNTIKDEKEIDFLPKRKLKKRKRQKRYSYSFDPCERANTDYRTRQLHFPYYDDCIEIETRYEDSTRNTINTEEDSTKNSGRQRRKRVNELGSKAWSKRDKRRSRKKKSYKKTRIRLKQDSLPTGERNVLHNHSHSSMVPTPQPSRSFPSRPYFSSFPPPAENTSPLPSTMIIRTLPPDRGPTASPTKELSLKLVSVTAGPSPDVVSKQFDTFRPTVGIIQSPSVMGPVFLPPDNLVTFPPTASTGVTSPSLDTPGLNE